MCVDIFRTMANRSRKLIGNELIGTKKARVDFGQFHHLYTNKCSMFLVATWDVDGLTHIWVDVISTLLTEYLLQSIAPVTQYYLNAVVKTLAH